MVLASTSATALLVTSTFCKEATCVVSKSLGHPRPNQGPLESPCPAPQSLPGLPVVHYTMSPLVPAQGDT